MSSLNARIFRAFSRINIKRHGQSVEETVAHMRRQLDAAPMPTLLPLGVKSEPSTMAGIPALRVSVKKPLRTVLYLHGGGYVAGRPETYRNLAGRLAKKLRAEVYIPDYRLAPEHPYPAALDDSVACYRWLLESGVDATTLAVAGDSAGGCLTLAVLLRLRDEGTPLPAAAAALSPAGHLACDNPSMDGNDHLDSMLSADMIRNCAKAYATGEDVDNPYLSPALGDFRGIPPMVMTVDEEECLRDGAHEVAERQRAAGGEVKLISRWGLFHVWPIFTPLLREAREDVAQIADFLDSYLNRNDRLKPAD
ncbi:MAG: alpha/beta hydrolase [Pseudomonadota bacterium]